MAQTNYIAEGLVAGGLYSLDSTPQFALGTVIRGRDRTLGEGAFVYLKGVDTCVEGHFVTYRPKNFTAILLAANAIGAAGIALAACTSAYYGWFQIAGKGVAKAAAAYADDALVYATATAGVIDDAVVAGDRVKNARSCSALDTPATGYAYIDLYPHPFMDDASAA